MRALFLSACSLIRRSSGRARVGAVVLVLLACSGTSVSAQTLREHATPFSVWLDLAPHAPRPAFPIWLESLTSDGVPKSAIGPGRTVHRLRLRRMGALNREVQLRVLFQDEPDRGPKVTAWSETGALRYESPVLGLGLGLPSSEVLTIPVADADYVEIEAPGDGLNLRGLFLSTLKAVETRHAADFAAPPPVADAFDAPAASAPGVDDAYLYGRVKATLDRGVFQLLPRERQRQVLQFDLEAPPLIAVLTFEVLNADALYPPDLTVNSHRLGAVAMTLPDLADPAFLGTVRPLERDMTFRYSGWIRCQRAIPASSLQAGLNEVVFELNSHSGPIAIRSVEIQLKNAWRNLNYQLLP